MIQRVEISGVHTAVDPALRRYVSRKIGGLDRYIPRSSRASAHLEVFLKETRTKKPGGSICEVKLRLPKQTIVIKEKALNLYAAVDISEAKLKQQLKKYKDQRTSPKYYRHIMARFRAK